MNDSSQKLDQILNMVQDDIYELESIKSKYDIEVLEEDVEDGRDKKRLNELYTGEFSIKLSQKIIHKINVYTAQNPRIIQDMAEMVLSQYTTEHSSKTCLAGMLKLTKKIDYIVSRISYAEINETNYLDAFYEYFFSKDLTGFNFSHIFENMSYHSNKAYTILLLMLEFNEKSNWDKYIEKIIKTGTSIPDFVDENGDTALINSCKRYYVHEGNEGEMLNHSHAKIVKLLLHPENHPDVSHRNNDGFNALILSIILRNETQTDYANIIIDYCNEHLARQPKVLKEMVMFTNTEKHQDFNQESVLGFILIHHKSESYNRVLIKLLDWFEIVDDVFIECDSLAKTHNNETVQDYIQSRKNKYYGKVSKILDKTNAPHDIQHNVFGFLDEKANAPKYDLNFPRSKYPPDFPQLPDGTFAMDVLSKKSKGGLKRAVKKGTKKGFRKSKTFRKSKNKYRSKI